MKPVAKMVGETSPEMGVVGREKFGRLKERELEDGKDGFLRFELLLG